MTPFEKLPDSLASVVDKNADGEELMEYSSGAGRLKTLAQQTHENAHCLAQQTYAISNAMAVNKELFPDWMRNSRFWLVTVSVNLGIKPAVVFTQFMDDGHRFFTKVRDYYANKMIDFMMVPGDEFWYLRIELENFYIEFKSKMPVVHSEQIPFITAQPNGPINTSTSKSS